MVMVLCDLDVVVSNKNPSISPISIRTEIKIRILKHQQRRLQFDRTRTV